MRPGVCPTVVRQPRRFLIGLGVRNRLVRISQMALARRKGSVLRDRGRSLGLLGGPLRRAARALSYVGDPLVRQGVLVGLIRRVGRQPRQPLCQFGRARRLAPRLEQIGRRRALVLHANRMAACAGVYAAFERRTRQRGLPIGRFNIRGAPI
jgi:hypothetical protein